MLHKASMEKQKKMASQKTKRPRLFARDVLVSVSHPIEKAIAKRMPISIDIYRLPTAHNVCNQTLREVISLPKVSMAHVTMDKGDVSLWHRHSKMTEIYFILDGKGILYHGKESLAVEKGTYLMIQPGISHKLRNIGDSELEHLVLAMPPFNPNDVEVLEDAANERSIPKRYRHEKPPLTTLDGALIYELISQRERKRLDVALAVGFLPKGRKAIPHYHRISEEIYYVSKGIGSVRVGNNKMDVRKGSVVLIPKNMVHALENKSKSDELELLCISSPAYREGDFILEG
jgi:mannose-6-phosphate isomerase-like protein (cupin superfamily)